MAHRAPAHPLPAGTRAHMSLSGAVLLAAAAACAPATQTSSGATAPAPASMANAPVCLLEGSPIPCPTGSDARVGLNPGLMNAAEATWNLRVVSKSPPADSFARSTNSDLAFTGRYAIQGNYNGFQIWDISNPSSPTLVRGYFCPASQSDVSVYRNLLFVSAEGQGGRLDCGGQGVRDTVSTERIRGVRIFDISDIRNPRYVGNVQTCRGSHTHTVLVDPRDAENVYVYISGSAGVRSPSELSGCVRERPDRNPNSALFRIEVIKVPLARPEQAAIVSSPRIFNDLAAPARHGEAPEDIEAARRAAEQARARGGFTAVIFGTEQVLPQFLVNQMLDSIVKARGGTGAPTGADSATLRTSVQSIVDRIIGAQGPRTGPTQCHDITVYPAIGLAGGACEGYGFLLDIRDPVNPTRISAVADSNFSYWHSATFNNDGTKILFSDEWGGGGAPKCRATDRKEWGANAIFTVENNRQMRFQSYYKIAAPQTSFENCVAHNGSLIPIPGRDVMVQAWYQGGVSIFDWTDPKNPVEIAYHDRGPADTTRRGPGAGSWSAYWYNGAIYSSEISRGLDVFDLTPSQFLTRNEIDAAKTVRLDYFNAQGQPKLVWPPSFALARAYVDQLERSNCLGRTRVAAVRQELASAERASGTQRRDALTRLASQLASDAGTSCDAPRVRKLQTAVSDLAGAPLP